MTTSKMARHIKAAHQVLISIGLPRAQQNDRSALCLLALLNLTPAKPWSKAENPLMGITPIMDWAREHSSFDNSVQIRRTGSFAIGSRAKYHSQRCRPGSAKFFGRRVTNRPIQERPSLEIHRLLMKNHGEPIRIAA